MKIKLLAVLVVASFLLSAGSVLASSVIPAGDNSPHLTFNSSSTFYGNVTVFTNGSISTTGTGITHSGNTFELTSNINGSLTFLASNSILNGNNYMISGSYPNSTLLRIANNSVSTVENLTIDSSNGSSFGIIVQNATNDVIKNVKVYENFIGINVLQKVQNLNVTESKFVGNGTNESSVIALNGYNLSDVHSSSIPTPLVGTGNLTYFEDNLTSNNNSTVLISGSYHTVVSNSDLISKKSSSKFNSVLLGNDSVLIGNNIQLDNGELGVSVGFPFSALNIGLKGEQVLNNHFYTISAPEAALVSSGDSRITGNSFFMNNSTEGSLAAIFVLGNNTSVSGNSIHALGPINAGIAMVSEANYALNNDSVTDNSVDFQVPEGEFGILGAATNSTVSGNLITESNETSSHPGITIGISLLGNNAKLISNTVVMNGTTSEYGIQLYGSLGSSYFSNNSQVMGNVISITNASTAIGISLESNFEGVSNTSVTGNTVDLSGSSPNGIVYQGSNVSIEDNTINLNSTVSSTGIGSFDGQIISSHERISGNQINSHLKSTGSIFGFYFEYNLKYSVISDNVFSSSSLSGSGIELEGTHNNRDMIYSNEFTFPSSRVSKVEGLEFSSYTNGSVSNNTITHANESLGWVFVGNVTVNGNYFYDQYTAINIGLSDHVKFYHNDFVNFTRALSLGPTLDLYFNASYPVGGNYWSNYTGVDKYSGPQQNIPGPDGIGDTPYYLAGGYADMYPLMKPWTRPAVTFVESGLPPGKSWSVIYDGRSYTSTQSSISFNIVNGTYQTYSYSVQNVTNYYKNTSSYSFNYTGNGIVYDVVYLHYAYLTGTVSPGSVTIKIGNSSYNITNGHFNFTLKAGNYTVEFIHSGYDTKSYQVLLTQGENKSLSVKLVKPSDLVLYYVIGGIAAVAVVGGAAYIIMRRK